jgi:hypothetical protein
LGRGQPTVEQQVQQIIKFAEIWGFISNERDKYKNQLEQVQAYCRLLQEGDPENENPKKILDEIDKITERNI